MLLYVLLFKLYKKHHKCSFHSNKKRKNLYIYSTAYWSVRVGRKKGKVILKATMHHVWVSIYFYLHSKIQMLCTECKNGITWVPNHTSPITLVSSPRYWNFSLLDQDLTATRKRRRQGNKWVVRQIHCHWTKEFKCFLTKIRTSLLLLLEKNYIEFWTFL